MSVPSPPLLATKFFIPPARPAVVARHRLFQRLDAVLTRRLALVCAPAGFGKTTLVAAWLAGKAHDPPPSAAWLSLDEADNDPLRFLTYLTAVIDNLNCPGVALKDVRALLNGPEAPQLEPLLALIVNRMSVTPESDDVLLVLDDYHLLTVKGVHQSLLFLLDHLPPHVHFVICTRFDPPLPLARLRAREQLVEIRAADLRFTHAETAELLNQVMGLNLSASDISTLEARTEGWIASLQLAAISLQARPSETAGQFIQAFSGSNRFVMDYLVEEVLQTQPPDLVQFLLHTSILERFSASLCDFILQSPAPAGSPPISPSQPMLDRLERSNLFLMPLDDEREWYRYHQLFADVLRHRLRRAEPLLQAELHRRASQWFEHHDFLDEAIQHALAARAHERAADLLEQNAERLLMAGRQQALGEWIERLPPGTRARPRLGIAQAYVHVLTHQLDSAERCLAEVERLIAPAAVEPSVRESIGGELTAMRSNIALNRGNLAAAAGLAQRALAMLPPGSQRLRGQALYCLGVWHNWRGALRESLDAHGEAFRLSLAAGDLYYAVMAKYNEAGIRMTLGEAHHAADIFQQSLRLAEDHGSAQMATLGIPRAMLSELHYLWNDLTSAERYAREAIQFGERGGNPRVLALGFARLAWVLQAQQQSDGAWQAIERALRLVESYRLPDWHTALVQAARVRVWLAQSRLPDAVRWADAYGSVGGNGVAWSRLLAVNALARVRLAQAEPAAALSLLDLVLSSASAQGDRWAEGEAWLLRALALQRRSDRPEAFRALIRAVDLCLPEGLIRRFLDEGIAARDLLAACRAHLAREGDERRARLISTVLDSFPAAPAEATAATAPLAPQTAFALAETLSTREVDVLRLLAEGFSNKEIAGRLYITLGTAKRHATNIYGKLGVRSRTQAVRRARELGLL